MLGFILRAGGARTVPQIPRNRPGCDALGHTKDNQMRDRDSSPRPRKRRRVPTLPRRMSETAGRTVPGVTDLGEYMEYLGRQLARTETAGKRPSYKQLAARYGIKPEGPNGSGYTHRQCEYMRERWAGET